MRHLHQHQHTSYLDPAPEKRVHRLLAKEVKAALPPSEVKAGVYLLNERVFIFWEEDGFMFVKNKAGLRKYSPSVDFEEGDLPPEVKAGVEIAVINRDAALRMMWEQVPPPGLPKEQQLALKEVCGYLR